jgi:hypothetical protein
MRRCGKIVRAGWVEGVEGRNLREGLGLRAGRGCEGAGEAASGPRPNPVPVGSWPVPGTAAEGGGFVLRISG